ARSAQSAGTTATRPNATHRCRITTPGQYVCTRRASSDGAALLALRAEVREVYSLGRYALPDHLGQPLLSARRSTPTWRQFLARCSALYATGVEFDSCGTSTVVSPLLAALAWRRRRMTSPANPEPSSTSVDTSGVLIFPGSPGFPGSLTSTIPRSFI